MRNDKAQKQKAQKPVSIGKGVYDAISLTERSRGNVCVGSILFRHILLQQGHQLMSMLGEEVVVHDQLLLRR
jgi:hypothetical protein